MKRWKILYLLLIAVGSFFLFENYQWVRFFQYKLGRIFSGKDSDFISSPFSNSTFCFPNNVNENSNESKQCGLPFEQHFNVYLQKLDLLNFNTELSENEILDSEPIVLTATSSNHFRECLKFFAQLQTIGDKKKQVIVYDLGLSWLHIYILQSVFGDYIIEIRRFNFENYPPYVANLREYRWKPIIIAETLKSYPSIWYLDTSTRILNYPYPLINLQFRACSLKETKNYKNYNLSNCTHYPWILFFNTSHGINAATNSAMYKYLPIAESESISLTMWSATVQLIFGTQHLKKHALKFWVLCALQENCMSPPESSRFCNFDPKDRYKIHANCHRYDQSAINIILAAINDYNEKKYSIERFDEIEILKDSI